MVNVLFANIDADVVPLVMKSTELYITLSGGWDITAGENLLERVRRLESASTSYCNVNC